jgi:membrane fusion protein, multidrug efflux system
MTHRHAVRTAHFACRRSTTAPIITLAAVLTTAALLSGCTRNEATVAPAPTPVQLAEVSAGPSLPPIEVTAVVSARDEQRLSFKVAGLVQRVAVREGDRVRKGQLLAALDATEVASQVEQARQMADKAARDLARGEALHADQVIPLEQLQNLRTQADMARSALRAARFNEQYAIITAPGDGVVMRRLVEERELVAPGQVALLLGRNEGGHVVRFAVSDRDIVQLRRGDAVEVRLDAWPGEAFTAQVTQIASAADVASGLFEVEAALTRTPRQLASGMVGRVRLSPSRDGTQLAHVPIGAVLEGTGDRATVYVTEGDVARRREIAVAFITADTVAVRSGIAVGEKVVAIGAPYLRDGDRIAVSAGTAPR